VPPFVCGGECVGSGGSCTTSADCCPGLPCTVPPGSTRGTCGSPPSGDAGQPPPGDAAPPVGDANPPDDATIADAPVDGPKPPCAEYGQICTTSSDCCNGVPCVDGRCRYVVK
jgi:hypothetical protein